VRKRFALNINGKDYLLGSRTWFMGVLNVTPDSFSEGSLYFDKEKAVDRGLELVQEGADIIDVGGESSRPGSDPVPREEEMRRIIPVISDLKKKTSVLISVDTTKSEVAEAAVDAGADMVNDISAFRFDPRMSSLIAKIDIPVILMHMKGTPKTMQDNPHYDDVLGEVKAFLRERIKEAQNKGVKKEKILIDPGIGFGKRLQDNLALINRLGEMEELDRLLLVGVSRKSFIGNLLNLPPQERLEGTIASSLLSVLHGAHILRVHDVKAVKRAILVAEAIISESSSSPQRESPKKEIDHVC
jgi:dihydropteroate synthase